MEDAWHIDLIVGGVGVLQRLVEHVAEHLDDFALESLINGLSLVVSWLHRWRHVGHLLLNRAGDFRLPRVRICDTNDRILVRMIDLSLNNPSIVHLVRLILLSRHHFLNDLISNL